MNSWVLDRIGQAAAGRLALDDGRRSLTYGQLSRAIANEARWQEASGAARFALLADNSCDWVISDLALLSRGHLNVPLPAYFTRAQTQHALDDAAIDAVLTDDPQRVRSEHPEFVIHSRSPVTAFALLVRGAAAGVHAGHIPSDTVKVTYTSGSTAEPKGVCLSAASLEKVARSLTMVTRALAIDRHFCLLPLPNLLENVAGVYAGLASGATCCVWPSIATGMSYGRLDSERMLGAIARVQPESLILVPELLRLIVAAADRGWPVPPSLKFVAVGGAGVSPELLQQAAALGLPVYEGYGLSECASVVCLNTPGTSRRRSVGRPLPHAGVRIDARGQIRVRGALMSGYLGAAATHDEELATGDLGEIDEDGFVYVRGRIKNVFISSMGRNVSPEWIERELMRHQSIAHAVVFGEGRPHPLAILSPVSAAVSDRDLALAVTEANRGLPDYARIERWIRAAAPFTYRAGLLTANGRPRRDAIAALHGSILDASRESR